jgi:hypothetical protein
VFVSCSTASMIRRHTAMPAASPAAPSLSARLALRRGRVAVPPNHQIDGAPDVDLGYHAAKARRGVSITV